jgi:hypothetical protein
VDVKITSRNRVFRRIDTGIALLLIEALPDIFEPANEPEPPRDLAGVNGNVAAPRPKGEPVWELAAAYMEPNRIVGLKMLLPSGEVLNVGGPADGIRERCEKALAGRKFKLPSEALIREYASCVRGE